ncbi:unnamed protein product [Lactuca virosa]|uniref:Uncharacterized protein n=1 Tax=Lactuca virosa TaxID=75947 RepID=A0AAU9MK04_9ASTR|nr:unnamed protein product [Lactuca virosa]
MQGHVALTRGGMTRMGRQQEQYQIELDNLHQRMNYHHNNWMNYNARMTAMENQNDTALSLADGIEERHVALEEIHETLEESHETVKERHADHT